MIGRILSMTDRNRKPRWRAARRQALRSRGVRPPNQLDAWCVEVPYKELTAEMKQWLEERMIPGLGSLLTRVWLKPRDARHLMKGTIKTLTVVRTECRRCELCARPLVADEAAARRRLIESDMNGREKPCGPRCAEEAQSGVWRKLIRSQYRAPRLVA